MNHHVDPLVFLALDNCFASKRWTKPQDWIMLIRDLGIYYIEASADTECDPLYNGPEYLKDWINDVRHYAEKSGVRIVNLYSGHGTYSTLGLAHFDFRVRQRLRDQWLKPQIDAARALDAGIGYYVLGIDESVLQNPAKYADCIHELYNNFSDLAKYASDIGLSHISVEQMYSPHQPPWRVIDGKQMVKAVYSQANAPHYLTLDLGHMSGQANFLKPSREQIQYWVDRRLHGLTDKTVWLGSRKAMDIFNNVSVDYPEQAEAVEQIELAMHGYDYLFSDTQDCSVDFWLEELAAFSPIIHLQQTDGKSSQHWPFDHEHNTRGIIDGHHVLKAISHSFSRSQEAGMPQPCREIVLTLEPFMGTAANRYDAIASIAESVRYWRQFIPHDGMHLSELLSLING